MTPEDRVRELELQLSAKEGFISDLQTRIESLLRVADYRKAEALAANKELQEKERLISGMENVIWLALKDLREAQALGTTSNRVASAIRMLEEVSSKTEKRKDVANDTCSCGFNSLICKLHPTGTAQ